MYRPVSISVKNLLSYQDTTFNFRQGEPIVIVGDNRDDPGQKRNGSGKSGLVEGMVIAVTGDTIRNISKKELVRRGCDYGETEITFVNTISEVRLRIYRKIYAGSKSAEYRMWQNEIDQSDHYSDPNTFNAYVFKALGISKEDFFDFYIITKEHYKPFFATGDTGKKEVVNRFSGANKVDFALPNIEEEMREKGLKVTAIEKQIIGVVSKQELIGDQIKREEEKYSLEGKQELLETLLSKESLCTQELRDYQKELSEEENALKEEKKLLKKLIIDPLSSNKEEYEQSIKSARSERDELLQQKDDIKLEISSYNLINTDLTNQLRSLIECPKCNHRFNLRDKDFSIVDAKKEIATNQALIETLAVKVEELSDSVIEYNNGIRDAETDFNVLLQKERKDREDKRVIEKNIDSYESNIKLRKSWIEDKQGEIEKIKDKRKQIEEGKSEKIDELSEQILKYIDEETDWRERLQVAVDEKSEVEKWIAHFKSFKSFLANQSIANIEDYTNMYLNKMGTNLSIAIDGYRTLTSGKLKEEITISVIRDGLQEASYGTYSGGERGRIDVAVILALQTLINLNSPTGGLDIVYADEVFDSIESLGLECIVGALQNVDRTVMIVSQNEINSLADNTITIRKENKISTIV